MITDFIKSLMPMLKPEITALEAAEFAELDKLIAGVQSPLLKSILMGVESGLKSIEDSAIAKI